MGKWSKGDRVRALLGHAEGLVGRVVDVGPEGNAVEFDKKFHGQHYCTRLDPRTQTQGLVVESGRGQWLQDDHLENETPKPAPVAETQTTDKV